VAEREDVRPAIVRKRKTVEREIGHNIHKLAPPRWAGPLRSPMKNCDTDIS